MTNTFRYLMIGAMAAGLTAFAGDTAKQDMKKAGTDTKNAAHATGQATKHTAKGVKKGAKKGVNKTAVATANGANKVKGKTQQ